MLPTLCCSWKIYKYNYTKFKNKFISSKWVKFKEEKQNELERNNISEEKLHLKKYKPYKKRKKLWKK